MPLNEEVCRRRPRMGLLPKAYVLPSRPAAPGFERQRRRRRQQDHAVPMIMPPCRMTLMARSDTCFLEGCGLKRTPASKMCVVHTPICLLPECRAPRSETGLYCPSHSCVEEGCDQVISGSSFCALHRSCRVHGCSVSRTANSAGTFGPTCWKHRSRPCVAVGCKRVPSSAGGTFDGVEKTACEKHECRASGCRSIRQDPLDSTRLYCVDRELCDLHFLVFAMLCFFSTPTCFQVDIVPTNMSPN